jgi:hypothetical protein
MRGEPVMDHPYAIRVNIAHYRAMLQLNMDDQKRAAITRLLAEAHEALTVAVDSKISP